MIHIMLWNIVGELICMSMTTIIYYKIWEAGVAIQNISFPVNCNITIKRSTLPVDYKNNHH